MIAVHRSRIGTSEAAKRVDDAGRAFQRRRDAEQRQAAADAEEARRERAERAKAFLAAEAAASWASRQRATWAARQPDVVFPSFTPAWRCIVGEVCEKHGVTLDALLSEARTADITVPRFEAYYRMADETALSLPEIGAKLNRDHTSVLHGLRRHAQRHGLPLPRSDDGAGETS